MRKRLPVVAACPVLALVLAGCVNTTEALQIGPDTFTVSSTADTFRLPADARQSALRSAAARCASLGRNLLVVDERSDQTRIAMDTFTTITVNFRCVG